MKIEVNLDLLKDSQISADDFISLYLLYRNGYSIFKELKLNPNWLDLQAKGYVKIGATVENNIIRQEFIDLFSGSFDSMFAELLSTYPMKVNSPARGIRILHAKDPASKANQKSKAKYRKLIGTQVHEHKRIMKLLDVQLTVERDNLGYLQNLETWLNNHTWEKYEDIDKNTNDNGNRITRSL